MPPITAAVRSERRSFAVMGSGYGTACCPGESDESLMRCEYLRYQQVAEADPTKKLGADTI
jgi:hypothetical protein